jgi:hypothetical protein
MEERGHCDAQELVDGMHTDHHRGSSPTAARLLSIAPEGTISVSIWASSRQLIVGISVCDVEIGIKP